MKTQLTIAAAVLTLAACTPKFYPPQIATPESYVYGAGFSSDTTGVGERWWELFGDTTLDALVEQALANNRDVAVAAARVQQARANLKTVRAADRRGSHRRGRIYARDENRAVVCRRTDPLVGTVAVRGAAQRQTGRKGRNRGLGVGFGGRQALAGRRGRHDLLHAAGV